MKMSLKLLAAGAALCAVSLAAPPLAVVDSSQPFLLRGKQVPTVGVGSWPVLSGDRVATRESGALVSFRGGSYVTLEKNTEVLLVEKNGKTSLKLLKGKLSYRQGATSDIVFDGVTKTAKAGTLGLENGTILSVGDVGFFAQLDRMVAVPAPNTYPIQINWNPLPSGVTPGPVTLPVSSYR